MNMTRRGFIGTILAAAAAPAIVRASSIWVPAQKIVSPRNSRFKNAIVWDDPWASKSANSQRMGWSVENLSDNILYVNTVGFEQRITDVAPLFPRQTMVVDRYSSQMRLLVSGEGPFLARECE